MAEIIFNPEKISLPPGNGFDFYGKEEIEVEVKIVKQEKDWHIPVTAGINELSDRDFALLQAMPEYQWFIQQGIIVIPSSDSLTPPVGENPNNSSSPEIPDISNLSISKSEPIIKAETRESVLKLWLADPRTGIKDLVGDRMLELGLMPDV